MTQASFKTLTTFSLSVMRSNEPVQVPDLCAFTRTISRTGTGAVEADSVLRPLKNYDSPYDFMCIQGCLETIILMSWSSLVARNIRGRGISILP